MPHTSKKIEARLSQVDPLACACATIRRASRAVTQLYDRRLRQHGIEGPQFALLAMLDRLGECSQVEMGARFDLDKTTLSRNLKLLNERGWIQFAEGSDARERRVRLTNRGRERLAAARPAWREAQEQLRSALPDHDLDTALRSIDTITRAARHAKHASRPKGRQGRRSTKSNESLA